jgi:hypothetical protein
MNREDCFAVFEKAHGVLNSLSLMERQLCYWLALRADWHTNVVNIQRNIKLEFCELFDVKVQSVYNAVSKLRKVGILIPLGGGNYTVNKEYFVRF